MYGQPTNVVRTPPRTMPRTEPRLQPKARKPNALPLWFLSKVSAIMAPLFAERNAPPTPCITLAIISMYTLKERPQITEPIVNITKPRLNILPRPYMSPTLPSWVVIIAATSRYASMVQMLVARLVWRVLVMSGMASSTIVPSIEAISEPITTTVSTLFCVVVILLCAWSMPVAI